VYHTWFVEHPELLELTASEALTLEEELENQQTWVNDPNKVTYIILDCEGGDRPCGDVNCFIQEDTGELNVMIAEPESRRKGIAKIAVGKIMEMVRQAYPEVKTFVAKIQENNAPSRAMFEKLGFTMVRHVQVFQEVHYERSVEHSM
jgi:RimJ/RimL family protein N-acetyltransferase